MSPGSVISSPTQVSGDTPLHIIGTGPVSLLLRGLLVRQGFGEHELHCDPPPASLPDWLGQRAIALSLGSWQLLARVAPPPIGAPITTVEISLAGALGRTRLRAAELGVPAVGQVVRYEALHRALQQGLDHRLTTGPGRPAPAATEAAAAPAAASTQAPALTIIADGNPGDDSDLRDFGQSALLATVQASRPHEGVAWERFTRDGPLALLPLPENRCWSLVWCAPTEIARARQALPPAALEAALEQAFGTALGRLSLVAAPHLAPLQRRVRQHPPGPATIAIGNAAQTLHPVAGQGLNLGFRDAFVLAGLLGAARAGARPLSTLPAEFARQRRRDRLAVVAVTDTLATIFTQPLLHPLQSLALGALDLVGPSRRALARAFMFGLR